MSDNTNTSQEPKKHTNRLIQESSPYLLQHAHNPVDWHPWGEKALKKAEEENKPLLISIGYSACHWCHVMERESFEDEDVAALMNAYFVCIKVDREERPDVDQVYMNAVQLMTGRGGWPLNCFTLPDGKPFYGGTYFPKQQWIKLLKSIHKEYTQNPEKVKQYAERLTKGVQQSEVIDLKEGDDIFSKDTLDKMVRKWSESFDEEEGGSGQAPKFPLPNNYEFLLRYYKMSNNKSILDHVELTLDKMARGGIYDQAGGGFARYSTDRNWKVPHFEKMLYDNAQLVSLYTEAYQQFKKEEYKEVVYQTLAFIEREMTAENGAFFSALDADSEGEEGKFYIWSEDELKKVLGKDFAFAEKYYNIGSKSAWEGKHILVRDLSDKAFAKANDMQVDEVRSKATEINKKLLSARAKRVRPGLDDKSLTSWNALMLKGYADAYMVFGEKEFLEQALQNADFILKHQKKKDGGLYHNYKNGKSSINGYLEDYSFTIEAFIRLYEATFDEKWIDEAGHLISYAIEHFYDESSGMFYFTSDSDPDLIARKTEVTDNVIPASNSSMAIGLFKMGQLLYKKDYLEKSKQMLVNIEPHMSKYGPGYSNWGILMSYHLMPFYEVAITGPNAISKRNALSTQFIPNKILLGSTGKNSSLQLLKGKFSTGETMIYVCVEKACQIPVSDPAKALEQMQ